MPDDAPIEIIVTGIDELIARYEVSESVAFQLLERSMELAVDYVAQDAEIYPPETDANQPPPPYYIRGTGTQYAAYNRGESKQLGSNWDKEISLEDNGVIGTVQVAETNVPYAKYVHGTQSQMSWHGARGWRTVTKIKEDVQDKVHEFFDLAKVSLVTFLNGG